MFWLNHAKKSEKEEKKGRKKERREEEEEEEKIQAEETAQLTDTRYKMLLSNFLSFLRIAPKIISKVSGGGREVGLSIVLAISSI